MTLKEFFHEWTDKESVNIAPSKCSNAELHKVPKALLECYQMIDKATFPFGRIYSIEEAVKESAHPPFTGKWFVFGQDHDFSFWLCKYQKDQRGYSFTAWDHSSGSGIGEAAYEDLVTFLTDKLDDFEERQRSYEAWAEDHEENEDDDIDE